MHVADEITGLNNYSLLLLLIIILHTAFINYSMSLTGMYSASYGSLNALLHSRNHSDEMMSSIHPLHVYQLRSQCGVILKCVGFPMALMAASVLC